jgi:hypothetical protein
MLNEIPKKTPKFYCEICDTGTDNKKDFGKHLATAKHKKKCDLTNIEQKLTDKTPLIVCNNCNTSYKSRVGLWYHSKKCEKPHSVVNNPDYMTIISQLLNQNNELKNFIIEQSTEHKKETMEIVNKVIENTKPINNINTINGNVNNTQKFNINVFLNEQCKDAMNLSDFIKNIEVSREDLENNAQLGFVGGISKIFLDNLRQLSINERPIHCTDVKRETMYIKDDDKWTKETGSAKLNTVIQTITQKSTRTLLDWKKENPDYNDNDSAFSTRCIVIQRNSMAGYDRETYYPKVIHAIARETIVNK